MLTGDSPMISIPRPNWLRFLVDLIKVYAGIFFLTFALLATLTAVASLAWCVWMAVK